MLCYIILYYIALYYSILFDREFYNQVLQEGGSLKRVLSQDSNRRCKSQAQAEAQAEGVVAPCSNPLTLQLEQSGGRGSNPTSTFERHDKGLQTRLALSYFCDPSA